MAHPLFKSNINFIIVFFSIFLLIDISIGFAVEAKKNPLPKILLTAKERLSNKAADNQRVNNCKVPPEQRGTKPRSEACKAIVIK